MSLPSDAEFYLRLFGGQTDSASLRVLQKLRGRVDDQGDIHLATTGGSVGIQTGDVFSERRFHFGAGALVGVLISNAPVMQLVWMMAVVLQCRDHRHAIVIYKRLVLMHREATFFATPADSVRTAEMTSLLQPPSDKALYNVFSQIPSVFLVLVEGGNYWSLIVRLVSVFEKHHDKNALGELAIHALHKLARIKAFYKMATWDAVYDGAHLSYAVSELFRVALKCKTPDRPFDGIEWDLLGLFCDDSGERRHAVGPSTPSDWGFCDASTNARLREWMDANTNADAQDKKTQWEMVWRAEAIVNDDTDDWTDERPFTMRRYVNAERPPQAQPATPAAAAPKWRSLVASATRRSLLALAVRYRVDLAVFRALVKAFDWPIDLIAHAIDQALRVRSALSTMLGSAQKISGLPYVVDVLLPHLFEERLAELREWSENSTCKLWMPPCPTVSQTAAMANLPLGGARFYRTGLEGPRPNVPALNLLLATAVTLASSAASPVDSPVDLPLLERLLERVVWPVTELVYVVENLLTFWPARRVAIWKLLVKQLDGHEWSGMDKQISSHGLSKSVRDWRWPHAVTRAYWADSELALCMVDTIADLGHRVYHQLLCAAVAGNDIPTVSAVLEAMLRADIPLPDSWKPCEKHDFSTFSAGVYNELDAEEWRGSWTHFGAKCLDKFATEMGWIGNGPGGPQVLPPLLPPRPENDSFLAVVAMRAPQALPLVFDVRHWQRPPSPQQPPWGPADLERREIGMQVALWTALGYYSWNLTGATEADLEKLLTFETRLGRNPRGGVGQGGHEGRNFWRSLADLRRPAQGMDPSEVEAVGRADRFRLKHSVNGFGVGDLADESWESIKRQCLGANEARPRAEVLDAAQRIEARLGNNPAINQTVEFNETFKLLKPSFEMMYERMQHQAPTREYDWSDEQWATLRQSAAILMSPPLSVQLRNTSITPLHVPPRTTWFRESTPGSAPARSYQWSVLESAPAEAVSAPGLLYKGVADATRDLCCRRIAWWRTLVFYECLNHALWSPGGTAYELHRSEAAARSVYGETSGA